MKRRISLVRCFAGIVAAAVAVSVFSGCGAKSESSGGRSTNSELSVGDSTSSDSQGFFSIFGGGSSQAYSQPDMWDVLPRIDKTPASSFEYEYDGSSGGMVITNYKGKSPKVYIPDTLDGEPVVKAKLGDVEITHLILPKTLTELQCNIQYLQYANYVNPNIKLVNPYSSVVSKLVAVYVDPSVTEIGEEAFNGANNLTTVSLPENLTKIGSMAFGGCICMTHIELPDHIDTIDNLAFSYCTSLMSISIPDSVTSIGDCAFRHTALTSISIPNGVTSIGNSAFSGCSGLASISIPDSVTSIGDSAFSGCSGLTSISIPDSVTSIGDSTFYECTDLKSISIPDGVTSIGDSTFYKCTDLTSISIPDGVTSIGDYAFEMCTGLKSINIPAGIKNISSSAFVSCENLSEITYKGKTYTDTEDLFNAVFSTGGYGGVNGKLRSCPKDYKGELVISSDVTTICNFAFSGCTGITSISIPSSVTSIGHSAFKGCTGLTSISIPDGVTSIDRSTFEGCTNLTSISISDSVTSISDSAFEGCNKLSSITYQGVKFTSSDELLTYMHNLNNGCVIEESDSYWGGQYLASCGDYIGELVIPEGVESIDEKAFDGCNRITSIVLPDSFNNIGYFYYDAPIDHAQVYVTPFYYCSNLETIKYKGISYPYICDPIETYYSNTEYKYLYPEHIDELVDRVNIPDGYIIKGTDSDNVIFKKCAKYNSGEFVIPDDVTRIDDSAFYGCDKITKIVIPDGVTHIGSNAFANCTSLKSISIPESVSSIYAGTFANCTSLTSIKLPDGLKSFSMSTLSAFEFEGCTNLTSIYYKGKTYSPENIGDLYNAIEAANN